MANSDSERGIRPIRPMRKGGIEFRLIFVVAFMVFLAAELIERFMPWRWLAAGVDEQRERSIFARAKESAARCTAYAFMG